MTHLRTQLKHWIPPALLPKIRKIFGNQISFEGSYLTFEEATSQSDGYDSDAILEKVLDATLKVCRGEAAFERDSVAFNEIEYSWPLTAGLMWAAACCGGRLAVLDFGGALGSSYFQNRSFLHGLPEVCWSVVEQKHYVEVGRKYIERDNLFFYDSVDQCVTENNPNLILLSSVLQYINDPYHMVGVLNNTRINFLIIDRTPFYLGSKDKICIQKVPGSIYKASYPMWIFSEELLLAAFDGWNVISPTQGPDPLYFTSEGLPITFKGFIMERKKY